MASGRKIKVDLVQHSDDAGVVATFERVKGATGVGNVHRVVANATKVFPNYINYVYALRNETTIAPVERELAILCVLDKCQAEYEFRAHRTLALRLGLTESQVENVRNADASGIFDKRQRAILRFAERFAADPAERAAFDDHGIKDFLDDRQLIELALTLALYLGMSHFTDVIEIPAEVTLPFPKSG